MTPEDVYALTTDGLYRLLAEGHRVSPDAIAEHEYRGVSLGVPGWVERLSWKKFRKSFHRDETGALMGWNTRLRQNGLEQPDRPMEKKGAPFTFGPYGVFPMDAYRLPKRRGGQVRADQALMLDYGARPNPPHLSRLRDPLVSVHEGDASLLFGWSYLDLGFTSRTTPSFFLLQSPAPISHVARY